MTLSFSKLNEIAYLYENAVHGEQEVLNEDASDAGVSARKTVSKAAGSYFNAVKGVAKGYADVAGSQLKGLAGQETTSKNPLARAGNAITRNISAPSRAGLSFAKGLVTGQGSDKPAAKPKLADIRGGGGNTSPSKYKSSSDGKMYANYNDALAARNSRQKAGAGTTPPAPGAGSGAGNTPPGGAGAPGGKVIPTKPAGAPAGAPVAARRAATGDELRAAQAARQSALAANPNDKKGAEQAAVSAGVRRSLPTTGPTPAVPDRASVAADVAKANSPSVMNRPAPAGSALARAQRPATSTQATNAAGSSSAAASGSVVPQNDRLAASKKPIDIKASYEYDAYDLVLEYLLSQGHAETVAEAHYVMMEMDAEIIGDIVEEVLEEGDNYDKNRKRAAQRAAARNEARAKGQTGNVPGVGYVTPRRERETYTDAAGTERHKTGGRMPENK
jgi:hypothetical protein